MEITKLNNSFAYVEAEEKILKYIDQKFSCYMTGYRNDNKYIDGFWDGKYHFFDINFQRISIGLVEDLIHTVKNKFPKENIESNIILKTYQPPSYEYYSKLKLKSPYEIRDYQKKAFESAIVNKNVVLKAATGAGKSLIIYLILDYYIKQNKKILVNVPQIQLVDQLFEDFKDYNSFSIPIGLSTKNKKPTKKDLKNPFYVPELEKDVVIATWQTLQHQSPEYFEKFDVVLMDEVHNINGEIVQKIIKRCKNAFSRIGLTGTLKKDEYSELSIKSNFYKTDLIITARQLIDMGYASEVKIYPIELKHNVDYFKIMKERDRTKIEMTYINNSEHRLKIIVDFISKIYKKMEHNNTLILYRTIKNGFYKKLEKEMIKLTNDKSKVFVINGKTKLKNRKIAVSFLEENDGVVILASFDTFSTGINAKNINNIFFIESYSSMVKITQSIGRGVRQHKNKKHVNIFDVYDIFNYKNNLYLQYLSRIKTYLELEYITYRKLSIKIKD